LNSFIKIAAATAVLALISGSAFAQSVDGNTSTANSSVDTVVIQGIALSNTQGLNFGSLVKPNAGSGLVTVNTSDGLTVASPVLSASGGATVKSAAFHVIGDAGRTFAITTPASTTITDGTTTLTVALNEPTGAGTLTSGVANFKVGGSFTLAAAATAGTYTGSFVETVVYN